MSRTTDCILDLIEHRAEAWQKSCGYVRPTPKVKHEEQPLDYAADDLTAE